MLIFIRSPYLGEMYYFRKRLPFNYSFYGLRKIFLFNLNGLIISVVVLYTQIESLFNLRGKGKWRNFD
jgi:hypothetical protein